MLGCSFLVSLDLPLHIAQTSLLLLLSHLSTTYLLIMVAPTPVDARAAQGLCGLWLSWDYDYYRRCRHYLCVLWPHEVGCSAP